MEQFHHQSVVNLYIPVLMLSHDNILYPLSIELLHISHLRPEGHIPNASAIDVDMARLYGLGILPSIKVRSLGDNQYELLHGLIPGEPLSTTSYR